MWEPLVENKFERQIILDKIDEIYHYILSDSNATDSIGLVNGDAGVLLFLNYYDRLKMLPNERNKNYIHFLLTNIFSKIDSGFSSPTFATGLGGIIWTVNHLIKEEMLELEDYDQNAFLQYLADRMLQLSKNNNFDFLHGSIGIAKTLLEIENKRINKSLCDFVTELQNNTYKEKNGTCWKSLIHITPGNINDKGTPVINFSISHGMASICIFLIEYYTAFPDSSISKNLAKGILNFYFDNKNPNDEDSNSLYPSFYSLNENSYSRNGRLAWCYGDFGVAAMFYKAGKCLGQSSYSNESIKIMDNAAMKRGITLQNVRDAGICHGTSGVVHMFNRFYQKTKRHNYKDAALYWLSETLNYGMYTDGIGGFKKYSNQNGLVNDRGLLEGASGIGLVLISLISNIEPKWDKALMYS